MRKTITRAARLLAVVCLVAPSASVAQTAQRNPAEGLKETSDFIKAGGGTSEAVAKAKVELQKTLDAYNALVTQPAKDMKGDYKKLMKSVGSMNDRVADARSKIADMQGAGDVYFAGRAETIKNIQEPALQDRARQRMQESQQEFAAVLASLRETGEALEPFRKQLADHITYLGSDLSPSGTASLQPEAKKLNDEGVEIFAKTDEAISKANTYFRGLQPTS
jgi:predicted  nucleic acid-binding Zn-ribbon protein